MKTFAFLSILAAGSLMAGEKAALSPVAPPPSPTLWQWFVGGSIGYLDDLDTEMYHLHAGVDLPSQLGGFDQAIFLEVGYANPDQTIASGYYPEYPNGYEGMRVSSIRGEADLIPITLNYKLERALTDSFSMYFGGGIGAAYVDVDALGSSDDDWTFYGQVFGGLLYNINEMWEIYGGVRWIYIDDTDVFGVSVDSEDDWLAEIGVRINF